MFIRGLVQFSETAGHVRGFSSSNFDWRNLIVNENVNADDSMQDAENRNSEKWNNMRLNMNADAEAGTICDRI